MTPYINHAFDDCLADSSVAEFRATYPGCPIVTRRGPDGSFIRQSGLGFEITLGNVESMARPGLSMRALKTFARAVVKHEVAHAWHTDFVAYARLGKAYGFPLVNLFEDCRIEGAEKRRWARLPRMAGKRAKRSWGWAKVVARPATVSDPENYLLCHKNFIAGEVLYDGPATTATGRPAPAFIAGMHQRLQGFKGAVCPTTTAGLEPLLREWVAAFPRRSATPDPVGAGNDGGETATGNGPATERGEGKGLAKGTAPVSEGSEAEAGKAEGSEGEGVKLPPAPSPTSAPTKVETPAEARPGEIAGGRTTIVCDTWGTARAGADRLDACPTASPLDLDLVHRIKSAARSMLARVPDVAEVGESGSRLHLPGIAAGLPAFRRVHLTQASPRVLFISDFSGSMETNYTMDGGREFAVAMAEGPGLEVKSVVTGNASWRAVDARWLATHRPYCSNESVPQTLESLERRGLFSWADIIVIQTDGDLTDGAPGNRWRHRGIDLVGLLISDDMDRLVAAGPTLAAHFTRGITAETPVQAMRALVAYALRHKSTAAAEAGL